MDVTPSKKMLEAFLAFTGVTVGEAPDKRDKSAAAEKRRAARERVMAFLHDVSRLSMREGVARYFRERGKPTMRDEVRPNPLGREIQQSLNAKNDS